MCVTFLNIDSEPDADYKLILVNNRDEHLDRVTSGANWERGILAGHDELEKVRGTWLCIDEAGRIANLLTLIKPYHLRKKNAPSRGIIPLEFLRSNLSPQDYCQSLTKTCEVFDAFQLLCMQRNNDDCYELYGLANEYVDTIQPMKFSDGIHGFGNSPFTKPFLKIQRGIRFMEEIVEDVKQTDMNEKEIINRLLALATDRCMCYPDEQLRKQIGRCSEICKYRSSLYVQHPDGIRYGTRSHTVILVDRKNHATFYEKRMIEMPIRINDAKWAESIFQFDLC